ADVNAKTTRGQTALMWAAAERHAIVAKTLIETGADVKAHSAGKTPANRNYAGRKDEDVAKGPRPLLKNNEAMNPEFRRDRRRGREGPKPEGGYTPLLYAAMAGDRDTVKVLLDGGAPINDPAADGTTALIISLIKGHTALAMYLIDRGADTKAAGPGFAGLHV